MEKNQPHKKVVSIIMGQIFSRELTPGTKPPPERELAKKMHVNRTSLRTGLKQLEAMALLDIRHGDGIYVKDYLKNTGIDFFKMLFSQPKSDGKEWSVDRYLIDEMWEYWAAIEPEMIKLGLRRFSARDIKALIGMFEEELESMDDRERIIDLELMEQDLIADVTNNTIFILLSNSSRPLRKKMVDIFIKCIDDSTLRRHIEGKKALLEGMMNGSINPAGIADKYRQTLNLYRDMVRKSMFL